ncbi:MAG: hypothetical protein VKQ33_15180 [Candidatus Sericytochromatia bacterium]|nr:hypothetical protein [Candidatus Sericytochromatia bacterium]
MGPLLLLVLASRLGCWWLGVRLDVTNLLHGWHLLEPAWLTADLLRSVWHLHATPPLLNLGIGVVLKVAGPAALAPAFWALGGLLTVALLALLRGLGLGAWSAAGLTALFMLSPACLLYEHWLFYTYPVTLLLVAGTWAFHRWLQTGRVGLAWLSGASFAAASLTMAAFHLLWLLAVSWWGLLAARRQGLEGWGVRLAFGLPAALVAGWYLKNLLLFGVFGPSSWLGMNLSRVTLREIPLARREAYVAAGRLGPVALKPAFEGVEAYAGLYEPTPPTGVPALDACRKASGAPNMNHRDVVPIARAFQAEVPRALALEPGRWVRSVALAQAVYFQPASDFPFPGANPRLLRPWAEFYEAAFGGCWRPWLGPAAREAGLGERAVRRAAWWLVVATPLLVLWALRRAGPGTPRGATLGLAVGCVVFVWALGFIEQGENNRFRFATDPLLLALLAAWLAERRAGLQGASARPGDRPL